MDARTLLILVCVYAMIFSYPPEPGYAKQHDNHVLLQYSHEYLFSLRVSSTAEHLLHSDFTLELECEKQNTTGVGKTKAQRINATNYTFHHCTLFERPLTFSKNGRIASKCELHARVQTSMPICLYQHLA